MSQTWTSLKQIISPRPKSASKRRLRLRPLNSGTLVLHGVGLHRLHTGRMRGCFARVVNLCLSAGLYPASQRDMSLTTQKLVLHQSLSRASSAATNGYIICNMLIAARDTDQLDGFNLVLQWDNTPRTRQPNERPYEYNSRLSL